MSGQYIGAAIMLFTTIGLTALLCLPAIKLPQKNQLLRFYWIGFWGFLAAIMAFSGAQSTLKILGHDVERIASAMLYGITAAFVVFVMFAWARLALKGAAHVWVKTK